jgi:hypothetical protein
MGTKKKLRVFKWEVKGSNIKKTKDLNGKKVTNKKNWMKKIKLR